MRKCLLYHVSWVIGNWKFDIEMEEENEFVSQTSIKLIFCDGYLATFWGYKDVIPAYQLLVKNGCVHVNNFSILKTAVKVSMNHNAL